MHLSLNFVDPMFHKIHYMYCLHLFIYKYIRIYIGACKFIMNMNYLLFVIYHGVFGFFLFVFVLFH